MTTTQEQPRFQTTALVLAFFGFGYLAGRYFEDQSVMRASIQAQADESAALQHQSDMRVECEMENAALRNKLTDMNISVWRKL